MIEQTERPPTIEVDWDKIETRYVPDTTKPFSYTTQASKKDTIIIDRSTMHHRETAQTDNRMQRPNVFDVPTDTSEIKLLQKPDKRSSS